MGKRLLASVRGIVALCLMLFATNFLPVLAVMTQSTVQAAPDPKVFVCKYVGTPGINETLQTGQNPISVSVNATGGTAVGSSFNDAQGRSFVLAVDDTAPGPEGDPDVSACPAPQGPTTIPVPTVPTNDPCGPANISFGTVPTSASYTFVQNSTSVTFTTAIGFVFTGGSTTATVNLPADSNVACPQEPTTIPVPNIPVNDPCGPNNIAFGTIPTSANYSHVVNGNGSVTFTAATGFVFTGNLTTATVNLPADSNVACPQEPITIPVPTIPTNDPCGPANVSFGTIPTSANYSHVVNGNGSVTFTAATGFVFTGGSTTATVNLPADSNVACPPTVIPIPTVPVIDPCGPNNATYGQVPSGNYTVQVNANGSITLTATAGNVFTGGLTSVTLPAPVDSNTSCGEVQGDTDVCPNIAGSQTTVPSGMVKDATTGNCVTPTITTVVSGGRGGEVLAATTTGPAVLADTGESTLTSMIVGLVGVTMALGLALLSRKQTTA